MNLFYSDMNSPLGKITVWADDNHLIKLSWQKETDPLHIKPNREEVLRPESNELLREAVRQLQLYFEGKLRKFDLPLNPAGTGFQRKIWQALQEIPYGNTWCYQELARRAGNARAMRAAGNANSRNPIPVIIPCHRVIQKNGKLGGFSGGIHIKQWLLAHEGVRI